jgi:hypothetical protein
MRTIEFKDDSQVGELRFVRNSELLDKSESPCEDCADPDTGSDNCGCEDF